MRDFRFRTALSLSWNPQDQVKFVFEETEDERFAELSENSVWYREIQEV